jgi:hypothetical protein
MRARGGTVSTAAPTLVPTVLQVFRGAIARYIKAVIIPLLLKATDQEETKLRIVI